MKRHCQDQAASDALIEIRAVLALGMCPRELNSQRIMRESARHLQVVAKGQHKITALSGCEHMMLAGASWCYHLLRAPVVANAGEAVKLSDRKQAEVDVPLSNHEQSSYGTQVQRMFMFSMKALIRKTSRHYELFGRRGPWFCTIGLLCSCCLSAPFAICNSYRVLAPQGSDSVNICAHTRDA